jgi:hypothetical protein
MAVRGLRRICNEFINLPRRNNLAGTVTAGGLSEAAAASRREAVPVNTAKGFNNSD